mmetsp:Transcript_17419/g.46134  ORF Transcript_17419/g.46134 Transcript_17419/m.46134 type:complete len:494 (+) Transcript_17419:468-1949(+)
MARGVAHLRGAFTALGAVGSLLAQSVHPGIGVCLLVLPPHVLRHARGHLPAQDLVNVGRVGGLDLVGIAREEADLGVAGGLHCCSEGLGVRELVIDEHALPRPHEYLGGLWSIRQVDYAAVDRLSHVCSGVAAGLLCEEDVLVGICRVQVLRERGARRRVHDPVAEAGCSHSGEDGVLEDAAPHILRGLHRDALVAGDAVALGQRLAYAEAGADDEAAGLLPDGLEAGEHAQGRLDLARTDHREDDGAPLVEVGQGSQRLLQPRHLLRPEHVIEVWAHGLAAERPEEVRHRGVLGAFGKALLVVLVLVQVEGAFLEAWQPTVRVRCRRCVHGLGLHVELGLRGETEPSLLGRASALQPHVALLPRLVDAQHHVCGVVAHENSLLVDAGGVEAGGHSNLHGIHLEVLDVDEAGGQPIVVLARRKDGRVGLLHLLGFGACRSPQARQRTPPGDGLLAHRGVERAGLSHDLAVGQVGGQGQRVARLEVPLAAGGEM